MASRTAAVDSAVRTASTRSWNSRVRPHSSDSGRFDDRYDWRLEVRKLEPPPAPNGAIDPLPFELVRIELVVAWREGRATREAAFVTQRVQVKAG